MDSSVLFFTYPLSAFLIILMAIGLGVYLTRKFNLGWRLYLIGAAGFILSQVGHIPFNNWIGVLFQRGVLPVPPAAWRLEFNVIFLGLSAGIFEEVTRYAVYRWWARDARSWSKGLLLGAGHGGVEALFVAGIILLTYLNMVTLRGQDLTAFASGDQLEALRQQFSFYWSAPWHMSLLGALERALAIPVHVALSILILQVFIRGQSRWLWLAILWHAMSNAVALYVLNIGGAYASEGSIALFTLASLGMIYALRGYEEAVDEPAIPKPESAAEPTQKISAIESTPENLDRSRFME